MKKFEYEIYRLNIDNTWDVNNFSLDSKLGPQAALIEASLYLSETVIHKNVLLAILFVVKENGLKPLVIAYESAEGAGEGNTVIQPIRSDYIDKVITKMSSDKLFKILKTELLFDCPNIYNKEYLQYDNTA